MDLPLFDLCHRNSSVSSLESLEAWMESYVPLSNLPTPPPSRGSWSPQLKYDVPYDDLQNEDLISPSIYLANMIPKPACVVPASPLIIQAFLHRAAVEVEVVALAACIIDRLSNKFALNWRRECPLVCRDPVSIEGPFVSVHGDCHGSEEDPFPRPEIVALASLMLAVKFLDDRVRLAPTLIIAVQRIANHGGDLQSTPTSFWAQRVSGSRFSCSQLNTTERLILRELDFRIQLFCTPACISSALRALKATGKHRSGAREAVKARQQRNSERMVGSSSSDTHVRFK
ncbi:MAG: hypothetical protein M1840_007419 [Geoglossum simile]|nr:MAG: hypothetical protein M1840_007419 [Geoglossum simile]